MPFFEKKQFETETFGKRFSCVSCGLFKHCTTPKMEAVGNFKKKILIIGEHPDTSADQNGRPFAGRQERFLKHALDQQGIDLWEDCLVTTALK
jgi:uracil-DNA glycosylase family 4